jgi:hypothetical protein
LLIRASYSARVLESEEGSEKKRGPPKRDNPAQSRRFIEAAKSLGVDESGEAFRKALDKVVPKKPKGGNS